MACYWSYYVLRLPLPIKTLVIIIAKLYVLKAHHWINRCRNKYNNRRRKKSEEEKPSEIR
jgi:uncharacterized membrane protein